MDIAVRTLSGLSEQAAARLPAERGTDELPQPKPPTLPAPPAPPAPLVRAARQPSAGPVPSGAAGSEVPLGDRRGELFSGTATAPTVTTDATVTKVNMGTTGGVSGAPAGGRR
jgi:hypothetical protein